MADLHDDDAPLDPATERVRRKMLRLLAISIATMLISVMAVLVAVVYKINEAPSVPDPDAEPLAIALPAGATVEDMALDGDEALLRLGGPSPGLVRVDLSTGAIIARYRLTTP